MRQIVNFPAPRAVMRGPAASSPQADTEKFIHELGDAFASYKSTLNGRLEDLENSFNAQAGAIAAARVGGSISGDAPLAGKLPAAAREQMMAQLMGLPNAARQMEVGSDPDGGYTVPVEVDGTILPLLRSISPLRRWATIATLSPGKGAWAKIVTQIGAQSAWVGELDDRDETDTPVLGKVEITPEELMAMPVLTNYILEDSAFDLESFLSNDVTSEFALQEGIAFSSGDGKKKPLGFLAKPTEATADDARAFGTYQHMVSSTSGTVVGDDLMDMVTLLRSPFRIGSGVGWLMNSTTKNVIRKLKDANDQYLWRQGLEAGAPDTLLGYPIGIDESMPDIAADTTPIAFGNWQRGYAIVDRPGLKLIRDNVTKKGWTKLYFYRRIGGAPLDTNAVKMLKIKA